MYNKRISARASVFGMVVLILLTILLTMSLKSRSQALAAGSETWNLTDPMSTARAWHYATLLLDGKVLVVGGYNGQYYATCEIYDPDTGTWSDTGSMLTARRAHAGTRLLDGRVFVSGGRYHDGTSYHYLTSAEIYDPITGTWQEAGEMSFPRQYHAATLLQDGRVLVTGGYYRDGDVFFHLNSADLYDPVTGLWSPTAPMTYARARHTATLLPNGQVLVVGGSGGITQMNSAELFDPETETWTVTGSMTDLRQSHTATLIQDGKKVLVAGGYYTNGSLREDLASAELYDIETGSWSTVGKLNEARSDHTATLLLDGRVLVAGGFSLGSAEIYNPSTQDWTYTTPMTEHREWHQAVLLPDGQVLVSGGYYLTGTIPTHLSSAEIYTPSTSANRLPVANPDEYTVQEDTLLEVSAQEGVLANDSDPDGGVLTARLLDETTLGTVTLETNGSFTYTPQAGTSGSDTFSYLACDDWDPPGCTQGAVTITILPAEEEFIELWIPLILH